MATSTDPLVLPEHLSFSQKSTTQKCSWQYVLGRLLHAPERSSWASVGGTAVHSATEQWDLWTLEDRWVTDPKILEDLWIEHFDKAIAEEAQYAKYPIEEWRASGRQSKLWPDKENRAWWDDHGPAFVKAWVNWRMNNPALQIAELVNQQTGEVVPGIEVPGIITLANRPIKLYIDRVFVNGDGVYFVVDLKSGSHTPDDAGQLGTYNVGLTDVYGISAGWGSYWMARTGGGTPWEDMRMWPRERLDHEYKVTREIQEQGLVTATRSSLCSGCSVRDACYAVNGKDSDNYPLPWEVSIEPRNPAA